MAPDPEEDANEKNPPPLDEDDIALLKTYVSLSFSLSLFLSFSPTISLGSTSIQDFLLYSVHFIFQPLLVLSFEPYIYVALLICVRCFYYCCWFSNFLPRWVRNRITWLFLCKKIECLFVILIFCYFLVTLPFAAEIFIVLGFVSVQFVRVQMLLSDFCSAS